MNEALTTLTVSGETKDLSTMVKQFPVRDGEKPWTAAEVTEVADELTAERERLEGELVNADAEGEGWLFRLELDDPAAVDALMDATAYAAFLEEEGA